MSPQHLGHLLDNPSFGVMVALMHRIVGTGTKAHSRHAHPSAGTTGHAETCRAFLQASEVTSGLMEADKAPTTLSWEATQHTTERHMDTFRTQLSLLSLLSVLSLCCLCFSLSFAISSVIMLLSSSGLKASSAAA
jgi:hypothetical protein